MSTSKSGDVTIRTARLVLRGPEQRDLDAMFAVYSDPRAMTFWATDPHADPSVTQDLLDKRIADWADGPRNFQITIDDTYIGNVGNYAGDEVGYMLAPGHWGQGIATEALAAVIPHLWKVTAHDRLTADIDPDNHASAAVLRKLGFRQTHTADNTYFVGGRWTHSAYFALPRPAQPA